MEILPNIDPENIQKDHRDAVLDYKWMVREVLVWGEELDRKIDTILPDQPEEEEVWYDLSHKDQEGQNQW